jgi:hypothetical protein
MDRNIKTPGEHVKPPDMIAMFMRDKNRFDLPCIQGRILHSQERLFCAQTRIKQKRSALAFEINAIAFTSAGKNRAAHRPIIGCYRIRVFNSLPYLTAWKNGPIRPDPE